MKRSHSRLMKRKLRQQKMMGIGMLIITLVIFMMAASATNFVDQDVTAALITGPMGIWMLLSKEVLLV